MRNILYTRRKYEKINPAAFDQEIKILLKSETTNSLGEKVVQWNDGATLRAMVDKLNSSEEDQDYFRRNQYMRDIIVIITYINDDLLNVENRIQWGTQVLEIIDSAKAYARERWIRLKCVHIS